MVCRGSLGKDPVGVRIGIDCPFDVRCKVLLIAGRANSGVHDPAGYNVKVGHEALGCIADKLIGYVCGAPHGTVIRNCRGMEAELY